MGHENAPRIGPLPPVPQGRPARGVGVWLRAKLARPRASWQVAALALVVLLPTVRIGLVADDLFERLTVEGKLGPAAGRFDLFDLISDSPALRVHLEELGIYPWWIGPHTLVSYWRPLTALTHVIDYTWWPRAAWLMHLQNVFWYAGLVLACGALYRRLIATPWVAGLATVFYAFNHAHAFPASWVANRNALMSMFFGVLSLLAHDRWRSRDPDRPALAPRRRLWFGVFAWGAFALALLSTEAGLATVAYTVAYAACVEKGAAQGVARDARKRALSVLPYAVIVVVWRLVYRALGHGVVESGANLDPLIDRAAFLIHSLQTGPLFLASDVVGIPPDLLLAHPRWTSAAVAGAYAALALLGYAALPLLRVDRTTRFFVVGAVLGVVPFGGIFPSDRYLLWVGFGAMGLLAQLVGAVFGERAGSVNAFRYAVGCACIVRGVVSPALFVVRETGPGLLEGSIERMVETIPKDPGFAAQTVVLLNAPVDMFVWCMPIVTLGRSQPVPAHMYLLYAGPDSVTVSTTESHVLEERTAGGWLSRFADRAFRKGPMRAGETIDLAAMTARVESITGDGRPSSVRFTFPTNLDDPSLVLLAWGPHGLERITPPPPGGSLTLAPAPLVAADAFRPQVAGSRAVDED
jgi:hypothetical protein